MRIPIWLTTLAAVAALAVTLTVGRQLLRPDVPLVTNAGFTPDRITPNADGSDDVAVFRYSLARNARVTVTLEGEDGRTFIFRQDEPRAADDYEVLFSGVVDGYVNDGEQIEGEVRRRLIPDGVYTWQLTAEGEGDDHGAASGMLAVENGDAPLPELSGFTVSPSVFTPNQDGVHDRVQINVVLAKDAELSVYLQDEAGRQFFVPERQEEVLAGEAGRHSYDYEGGVDLGADPPPDGTYLVVAEARDAVGQEVRQTSELTLADGGKPLAQIVQQPSGADVVFVSRPWSDAYANGELVAAPDEPGDLNLMAITMPVGDLLVFKLTVENYSRVPIRTTGPEPGTVYEAMDERAATIGFYEAAGAWRVGIDCDNATSDYPWRWAIGTDDSLTLVEDEATGEVFRYLEPGKRSVVWGAVRMTDLVEVSNPQACWAGLIHEKVQVANSRVGARDIELAPAADNAEG